MGYTIITKELFVSAIESIRLQMNMDKSKAFDIEKLLDVEGVAPYDNSLLITTIIDLLHVYFPRDSEGFSWIEHYCFYTNFGKVGEEDVYTPEQFYDNLCSEEGFFICQSNKI